eukprot:6222420-Pyramimonas_sp.AAC.1
MAVAFQSDCFSELLKEKGHPIDTAKQWPSNPEDAGDLLIRDEIMSNLGPRDQSEFLFWESMKANDFEVPTAATKGNPIGKRWDRAIRGSNQISKALREGYGQKKTDTEKAAFRREWARKECAKKSTSWSKVQTEKRESWKKSVYIPLGRMAHFEGGGKAGWTQATRTRNPHRPPQEKDESEKEEEEEEGGG